MGIVPNAHSPHRKLEYADVFCLRGGFFASGCTSNGAFSADPNNWLFIVELLPRIQEVLPHIAKNFVFHS
jgi:hypothetical protein